MQIPPPIVQVLRGRHSAGLGWPHLRFPHALLAGQGSYPLWGSTNFGLTRNDRSPTFQEIKLLNIESIAQLQQRSDEAERQLWDARAMTDASPDRSIQIEYKSEEEKALVADTAAKQLRAKQDDDAAELRARLELD